MGATGVRMLVDAANQVMGLAEAMQIDGAEPAATLDIGGSTATTVRFIIEKPISWRVVDFDPEPAGEPTS